MAQYKVNIPLSSFNQVGFNKVFYSQPQQQQPHRDHSPLYPTLPTLSRRRQDPSTPSPLHGIIEQETPPTVPVVKQFRQENQLFQNQIVAPTNSNSSSSNKMDLVGKCYAECLFEGVIHKFNSIRII